MFGKTIKQIALATIALTALTGWGAGRTSSSQARKATSPKAQQAVAPIAPISIPGLPELTFSSKLLTFKMPKVVFPENVSPRHWTYMWAHKLQYQIDVIREIAPYVPDIFYEKSQLPYAERIQFLKSPEKKKIMKALQDRFGTSRWGNTSAGESLEEKFLYECDSLLIFGRPLISLWAETESYREAVDLCGMTQLGKWMDIQKAKNRGLKRVVPDGYDEAEAIRQKEYLDRFGLLYGCEGYQLAVGKRVEKPIRDDLPYFSEDDFAHLTPARKKELLDLLGVMPCGPLNAPGASTGAIYSLYNEIKADKTGYRYVQQQRPGLSREKAAKVQKLCMEMVMYRRPLALLRAENYSLEQVIGVCQFIYADIYLKNRRNNNNTIQVGEKGLIMKNLQAKALKVLGKKYNHPDWVEFGQEMYEAGQKCDVAKHNDQLLIHGQVAQKSDYTREDGKSTKAADSSAQKKAQSSAH